MKAIQIKSAIKEWTTKIGIFALLALLFAVPATYETCGSVARAVGIIAVTFAAVWAFGALLRIKRL